MPPIPNKPNLDDKYAAFVAFAALESYTQLQELLQRWSVDPSPEIIADAAKYGQKAAMDRMFKGLTRHPFHRNPHPDIVLALRYRYEDDPEGLKKLEAEAPPSSVRISESQIIRRPDDESTRKPSPADTSIRRSQALDVTKMKLYGNRPIGDPMESSPGAVPVAASAPVSGSSVTKLKKISAPAALPWVKKEASLAPQTFPTDFDMEVEDPDPSSSFKEIE